MFVLLSLIAFLTLDTYFLGKKLWSVFSLLELGEEVEFIKGKVKITQNLVQIQWNSMEGKTKTFSAPDQIDISA